MSKNENLAHSVSFFKKFQHLRNFKGDQGHFFEIFLQLLTEVSSARLGLIAVKDPQKEWRTLALPKSEDLNRYLKPFIAALDRGPGVFPHEDGFIIVSPVLFDAKAKHCFFAGFLPKTDQKTAEAAKQTADSLSDLYAQHKIRQSAQDSIENQSRIASILEMNRSIDSESRFLPAVMSLTGELADKYACERVSLGWAEKGYVRLKAISHADSFEKKMEVVRNLENAMEEAFEQEACIASPSSENSRFVSRAHDHYRKTYDTGNLLSVPIEKDSVVLGVLTFERRSEPFGEKEISLLFLGASRFAARLDTLFRESRWFGARILDRAKNTLSKVLGYEHTWLKLFALLLIAFILFAAIVPVSYRVDAPAILLTDKMVYITAPFEGYIDSVFAKPGDVLSPGQKILQLDQKQLRLEEADLMAEEQNYLREIQKAQAAEELAEMRIYRARLAQTLAKLKTVRFKLNRSVIRSEMENAVVVSGDLQKRIGAPVALGEELFQIASIEDIYVEADVEEGEIGNVRLNTEGLISLKSRPNVTYRFRVERIQPSAAVKDQKNTFQVRGEFKGIPPSWFRPGMTGVAKIESGKKTLWWILTHQALDYLRLKLWW
ncbi:MAG: efflux RND transporter periplasmic adaptor subunit [Fibrobacter sp.]|jgi:multidrug efflux pump subunit AcrA (membrane-fusion protein)/GAF domain-containing protein|nr:efflux RND transporter periplasmic adaptor subunit [Fibrobacter sp.]